MTITRRAALPGRDPAGAIEDSVRELLGLALPLGLHPGLGRVGELWRDVRHGTRLDQTLGPLETAVQLAHAALRHGHAAEDLDAVARAGADLEISVFYLTLRERMPAARGGPPFDASGVLGEIDAALSKSRFDDGLHGRLRTLHADAIASMRTGTPDAGQTLHEAEALQDALREHLAKDGSWGGEPAAGRREA